MFNYSPVAWSNLINRTCVSVSECNKAPLKSPSHLISALTQLWSDAI